MSKKQPSSSSITTEVISASIGGAFSTSVLYPLEIIKTKLQAGGVESEENDDENEEDESALPSAANNNNCSITLAKQIYREGGISPFYSGVGIGAVRSATEKALYFFSYTALKNCYRVCCGVSDDDGGGSETKIGTMANLALGYAADWAHLPITLPIDYITTKIQTSTNKSACATLMAILSDKGMAGMYKGIQAYLILCFKPAIQYTIFEQVKYFLLFAKQNKRKKSSKRDDDNDDDGTLSITEAFLLGMISRAIATVIVFPYIRIKVMMQTSKNNSIKEMLKEILRDGGLKGLFRGLGPELTRGVLSAALMMMMKERIGVVVRRVVDG